MPPDRKCKGGSFATSAMVRSLGSCKLCTPRTTALTPVIVELLVSKVIGLAAAGGDARKSEV
eukprot:26906-Chlamydomonas_euryale.AAC.3